MNFRNEEKLKVASGKVFHLKNWINENDGYTIYPTRIINSIYFDNPDLSMFYQSMEGVTPRKKIRLRTYGKEFYLDKKVNKEVKITSPEGRYKISENIKNSNELISFGIYDLSYGLCFPTLNVIYKRSYYKIKKIRLTIDENIIYKKITNNRISQFSTFDNINIVELKYNKDFPMNIVNRNFPFERIRFSKYCRGIESVKMNYCNEL